ncbi:MAG: aminotransferase class V-fold PLP-dependent enzyme, partial [Acidobacteriota bacterium]
MAEYTRDLLEHGLVHWREWGAAVERVRELGARLVNALPDEIAFAPNTSAGLGMVANGIDWRCGDNIVTTAAEFPSNLLPWQHIASRHEVELRIAPERDSRLETAEILALIDERTRVVAVSYVEFATGFRNDLQTIGQFCRERGVLFVVDAIQGLGALRLDVREMAIDAFVADAHKFLLGPDGIALFYLRREVLEQVVPTLLGWMSVEQPFAFTPAPKPLVACARRFEPGALNTAGVVGLGAAIELFLQTGPERIEAYLLDLRDYLADQLAAIGFIIDSSNRPAERSSFVCVRHPQYAAEFLYHKLNDHDIITTPRLGRLRISPHFYNTREEVDRLINILRSICND